MTWRDSDPTLKLAHSLLYEWSVSENGETLKKFVKINELSRWSRCRLFTSFGLKTEWYKKKLKETAKHEADVKISTSGWHYASTSSTSTNTY